MDVKNKKQGSNYCNWFANLDFNRSNPYNDPFSYEPWNGCYNLVKLNTYNSEVKNYIFEVIKFWVTEFNIDGIRLDAADCMDINFLKELSAYCKSIDPELFVFGEVIHGDYSRWANKNALDAVTNYECYKGLYSSHNDKNYFEIAYSLNRQFGNGGIYKDLPLYNFVDNHDVNRVASTLNNSNYLYPLYSILFTMPGIPSIYYGSEWGIEGKRTKDSDIELRPEIDIEKLNLEEPHKDLPEIIGKLAKIRTNSKALCKGSYKQILVSNKYFVFQRQFEEEYVVVAVNLDEQAVSVQINLDVDSKILVDIFNMDKEFTLTNKSAFIDIPPFGVRILSIEEKIIEQ